MNEFLPEFTDISKNFNSSLIGENDFLLGIAPNRGESQLHLPSTGIPQEVNYSNTNSQNLAYFQQPVNTEINSNSLRNFGNNSTITAQALIAQTEKDPLTGISQQNTLVGGDVSLANNGIITKGLEGVANWLDELATHEIFDVQLPLLGKLPGAEEVRSSLGQALNTSGDLRQGLLNPITQYFATDTTPTVGEMTGILQNLTTNLENTNFTVNPQSIHSIVEDEEISFGLNINTNKLIKEINLEFQQEGEEWSLSFDKNSKVDLNLDYTFDLEFGYNPQKLNTLNDSFFVRIDNFKINGGVKLDNFNSSLNIGFLNASIVKGNIDLNIGTTVKVNNPDNDPKNQITLSELKGSEINKLVDLENSALSINANLPVKANLAGFNATANVAVTGDIIGAKDLKVNLTSATLEEWRNFTRLSPSQIVNAFVQFGNWLQSNGYEQKLDKPIPFLKNTNFRDLLEYATILKEDVFGKFIDERGNPLFKNLANFSDLLANLLKEELSKINARYDVNTHVLSFDFSHTKTFSQKTSDSEFNLDLGVIAELKSTSQIAYSTQGKTEFTLGFDLSPYDAKLTGTLPLPSSGRLSADAVFKLSVNGNSPVIIQVVADPSNSNPNHLIEDINTELKKAGLVDVTAKLAGDKLVLETSGNATGASLLILEINNIATNELGLKTVGVNDNLGEHVLLSKISLTTSANLTASDIDADGRLGIIDFKIIEGKLSADVAAKLAFRNPQSVNSPITLSGLFNNIGNLDAMTNVTFSGAASLNLPTIKLSDSLLGVVSQDLSANYQWSNVFQTGTVKETLSAAFQKLLAYKSLSEDQIIDTLKNIAAFFDSLSQGTLGKKLPLIDVSIADLAKLGDTVRSIVQEMQKDPNKAKVISAIETKLETAIAKALGIEANSNTVDVNLAQTDLRFTFNYPDKRTISENLSVDLKNLAIPSLTKLVDASGQTKLDGELTQQGKLVFGFDLGQNSIPRPYLHESTAYQLGLKAIANDIQFTAAVGPLGVFIQDFPGEGLNPAKKAIATIGVGTDPTTLTPATFKLGLQDISSDKYYLPNLSLNNVQVQTTGQAHTLLPTYYPVKSRYQGDIELSADLSSGLINLKAPDFKSIIESLDLEQQLGAVGNGIDELLKQLQQALSKDVLSKVFPFLGDKLGDVATFIDELRQQIDANLDRALGLAEVKTAQLVRDVLFDTLGPSGSNILDKNFNDDGQGNIAANIDDIRLVIDKDANGRAKNVLYELNIIDDFYTLSQSIGFDIGLPGLNFSIKDASSIDLRLGYEFRLGFGVSREQGVYLTTDAKDELKIGLKASIPDFEATGTLGFLQVKVKDEDADQNPNNDGVNVDKDEYDPSSFIAQFTVDITDPGHNDNRVTLSELASGILAGSLLNARVIGQADINLDLEASFKGNDNFPRIITDFHIYWLFDPSQPGYDSLQGNLPSFNFGHIYIDVGTFLSEFISPIINNIRSVLKPVDKVIDVLTKPIPVISDVLGPTTLLDLARFYGYEKTADFIKALAVLVNIVNNLDVVADHTLIDLGEFSIDQLFTVHKFDVRAGRKDISNIADLPDLLLANLTEQAEAALLDPNQQFEEYAPKFNSYAKLIPGKGFVFPLFNDPKQAIKLLFGRDVVLFEYDTPTLSLGFDYGEEFDLGNIAGMPITAYIGGGASLTVNFDFGYDTYGLRKYIETKNTSALLDGFYVVDQRIVEQNRDVQRIRDIPEVQMRGGLFGGVDVDIFSIYYYGIPLGSISVGGRAEIGLNIEMDIDDPNSDGRVRIREIAQNASQGLLCIFDTHGEVYGQLDAVLKVKIGFGRKLSKTIYQKKFKILRKTLADFNHSCEPPPVLAELDANTGVLTLNMGDRANLRQRGNTSDGDEAFSVQAFSDEGVIVSAFGYQLVYGGYIEELNRVVKVTKIVARGGAGNDQITIDADVSPSIKVELKGDAGNDTLIGGRGNDVLEGGAGNDVILGKQGDDTLLGQQGEDEIFGGEGQDRLEGGTEADDLYGEAGDDTIYGQQGEDFLYGGVGKDELHGGLDTDILKGEAGQDHLFGNEGQDFLYGGDDEDILEGNEESDYLFGDGGDDLLYGHEASEITDDGATDYLYGDYGIGSGFENAPTVRQLGGKDKLFGQQGDDQLFGEEGEDIISGGEGNDYLSGGLNNDTLSGEAGDDLLFGEEGEDIISGGEGNDSLSGGLNKDVLDGEAGDDYLQGNEDNDRLFGQQGDDRLFGEEGEDHLFGGEGNDYLSGGLNNDILFGEAGDDSLLGEEGEDQLFGGKDNDYLSGGLNNDTLSGEAGDDRLLGEEGEDQLFSGEGNDYLSGGLNNDVLYGGSGNDELNGNSGDDLLYGEAGNDTLSGEVGYDFLHGGLGTDLLQGGLDNDYLVAGEGLGNILKGEGGDDTLIGSDEGSEDPNFNDNIYFGDILEGGEGNDRILGLGGADIIRGGAGDDTLDGGSNSDLILGEDGNDILYGGGGTNDRLEGNGGDDTLYGSDDGSDLLIGGVGRDRLYGYRGNDSLEGGDGDDVLEGGSGDDLLEGEAGSDVLLGGANHDRLYGHNQLGIGDDNAVDYLYGDYGTNGSETDAGNDQLSGQGGKDYLFGEGGKDAIADGSVDDWVDYGNGLNSPGETFITPTPTPNPVLGSGVNPNAQSSLPTRPNHNSRWGDLNGSAEALGLSGDVGVSLEPSMVAGSQGQYVAWADSRNGNYEIYLTYYDGTNWKQLATSSEQGGISKTVSQSRRPSLTLDNTGNPLVAWTELTGETSDIRVVRYDTSQGAWIALGNSLGSGGISQTGKADEVQLINTSQGLVAVWLDRSSGTSQAYGKRFNGTTWEEITIGSGMGNGLSQSTSGISDLAVTTDGTKIAIAWTETQNGISQIYVKEYQAGIWTQLTELGNPTKDRLSPTLAYHEGELFVAWQQELEISNNTQASSGIYTAHYVNSQWVAAGTGSLTNTGVSDPNGRSLYPQLRSQGGKLYLLWADEDVMAHPESTVALYAKVWQGQEFVEELPGDASDRGISLTGGQIQSVALTVDNQGNPYVAWGETKGGSPEIYVRGNTFAVKRTFTANNTTSIQGILDANDLNQGDVIVIAPNTTITGAITLAADDAGVTILGAADGSTKIAGTVTINGVDSITLQRLTFNNAVTLANSKNVTVQDNQFTGINGLKIQQNTVSGYIGHNLIKASGTGLEISTTFDGLIAYNDIYNATVGIAYNASAALAANRIYNNATGVIVTVSGAGGLGFG